MSHKLLTKTGVVQMYCKLKVVDCIYYTASSAYPSEHLGYKLLQMIKANDKVLKGFDADHEITLLSLMMFSLYLSF